MESDLREGFEQAAAALFRHREPDVTKVWLDQMGDQVYVRGCFPGCVEEDLERLLTLRNYMRKITGRRAVAIAYLFDREWSWVDEITERLRRRCR